MRKLDIKTSHIKPQVFIIKKGLSRDAAYSIVKKKATRDFRGFTYNPDTGEARLI